MGFAYKTAKPPPPPPPPPPESWWDTLPGRITKWCGALAAMITVITAAATLFDKYFKHERTDDFVDDTTTEPILDQTPKGGVGWIYAGTRLDGEWKANTATHKNQPKLTLNLIGLPLPGTTYTVTHNVVVRVAPPTQAKEGAVPVMQPQTSTLVVGREVAVKDVREYNIDYEGNTWSWVWVAVTAVNGPIFNAQPPAK